MCASKVLGQNLAAKTAKVKWKKDVSLNNWQEPPQCSTHSHTDFPRKALETHEDHDFQVLQENWLMTNQSATFRSEKLPCSAHSAFSIQDGAPQLCLFVYPPRLKTSTTNTLEFYSQRSLHNSREVPYANSYIYIYINWALMSYNLWPRMREDLLGSSLICCVHCLKRLWGIGYNGHMSKEFWYLGFAKTPNSCALNPLWDLNATLKKTPW